MKIVAVSFKKVKLHCTLLLKSNCVIWQFVFSNLIDSFWVDRAQVSYLILTWKICLGWGYTSVSFEDLCKWGRVGSIKQSLRVHLDFDCFHLCPELRSWSGCICGLVDTLTILISIHIFIFNDSVFSRHGVLIPGYSIYHKIKIIFSFYSMN